jgi:hypothetical protein
MKQRIDKVLSYPHWDAIYESYKSGKLTLQDIVGKLPASMGIKYREQVRRILRRLYGKDATSRRKHSFRRSIVNDYPGVDIKGLDTTDSSTMYYSHQSLVQRTHYANRFRSSSEGSYVMGYYHQLNESSQRTEYDDRYRYLKSGLLLPYFILFVNGLCEVFGRLVAVMSLEAIGLPGLLDELLQSDSVEMTEDNH